MLKPICTMIESLCDCWFCTKQTMFLITIDLDLLLGTIKVLCKVVMVGPHCLTRWCGRFVKMWWTTVDIETFFKSGNDDMGFFKLKYLGISYVSCFWIVASLGLVLIVEWILVWPTFLLVGFPLYGLFMMVGIYKMCTNTLRCFSNTMSTILQHVQ